MTMEKYHFLKDPEQIERQSMKIISELLGDKTDKTFDPAEGRIIKRIIHTTADFDFAGTTVISPGALESARHALLQGNCFLTADTQMIAAGVNKPLLEALGGSLSCFVAEEKIKESALEGAITRSMANIRYSARYNREGIYLIGNAPTALYEVLRLSEAQEICPALVIGVPVGFVGAEEAKEELLKSSLPHISTKGRKGGSTVAVAIMNALLQLSLEEKGPPK
jgi:precorrin-8X/cobalt-precorrin-8 methylmutase